MREDIDREEFYEKLKYCKNLKDIEYLVENVDNDELQKYIREKYNQYLEYNKSVDIDLKSLINSLESFYLKFKNKIRENNEIL